MDKLVPMGKIYVISDPGHEVPMVDERGRTWMGRHVGRAKGAADGVPTGELVPTTPYFLRMVEQGALKLLASAGQPIPSGEGK